MIPGITAHIIADTALPLFTNAMETFVGGDYTAGTWATIDLSSYGVPADAVCIFITGNGDANDYWNQGVREVGSSLSRYVQLTEAESGGASQATFWVQADSSSQVQIYTEEDNDAQKFNLIGYFNSDVTFTERFDDVALASTDSIITLTNPGNSDIINLITGNVNPGALNTIGVRSYSDTTGDSDRELIVNEAEAGGGEYYCRTVELDTKRFRGRASTTDNTKDTGTISGMTWTGTQAYTNALYDYTVGTGSWTAKTLTNAVVTPAPGDIVEIICRNTNAGAESFVGVRDAGSSLSRFVDVHESEAGGGTHAVFYATVDDSYQIELYAETTGVIFYCSGWFSEI